MKWHRPMTLLALCCGAALADDVAVSVSTSYAYALDTTGSPYAVATAAEIAALPPVAWFAGETVVVTNPNGSATMLVESATSDATYSWQPTAGGIYAFANDGEGSAAVSVYYSAFGFNGSGTVGDPSHVIDSADFASTLAMSAQIAGFTFVLDGSGTALDGFSIPSGYAAISLGDGLWQLTAVEDGLVASSEASLYSLDTQLPGPDRSVSKINPALPFAYSGDGWTWQDASASSVLTFTSPSSSADARNCTGTDVLDYALGETGIWTVTLAYGSEILTAKVNFLDEFTQIIFR